MIFYLVKAQKNYADEFDLEGFYIHTNYEFSLFEKLRERVRKYFEDRQNEAYAVLPQYGIDPEDVKSGKLNLYRLYYEGKFDYATYKKLSDFGDLELYFGTNEFLTFSSFEEWNNCFTVEEITESEYVTLINHFGNSFGETCFFSSDILDNM